MHLNTVDSKLSHERDCVQDRVQRPFEKKYYDSETVETLIHRGRENLEMKHFI